MLVLLIESVIQYQPKVVGVPVIQDQGADEAIQVKFAVIVQAEKFQEPSLLTIIFQEFVAVAQ